MNNDLRGCRPFPVDTERKERCLKILSDCGMTMTELAFHLGVKKSNLSNVISGKDLSPTTEKKIADFFNIPKTFLFPERTALEIAEMRKAEAEQKARAEEMKAARMEIRRKALGVAQMAGFGSDCIKRVEYLDSMAELLKVEDDVFYIHAIFQEHEFFESLHTNRLVEACKQFNHVVKTLKA